jgi:hypothetical protein
MYPKKNSFRRVVSLVTYITVVILLLSSVYNANAQYSSVTISSGFNEDVIAEGIGGTVTALNTTTNAVSGDNKVFMANGFKPSYCAGTYTQYLPASLTMTSPAGSTPVGVPYTLAATNVNNNLRLASTNAFGTLVFGTPIQASNLYLLATSGSGAANITATVNFTDLTSQPAVSLTVVDWYQTTPSSFNVVVQQVGRVTRDGAGCPESNSCAPCGPNLYQYAVPINTAFWSKTIASVTIVGLNTAAAGPIANIMAVSAQAQCTVPSAQVTALTQGATGTGSIAGSFTAASGSPSGYLVVRYPAGTGTVNPVNGITYSTGQSIAGGQGIVVQSGATTSFTATGLTGGTSYDFYVYSFNTGTTCGGPVYNTSVVVGDNKNTFSTNACGGPVSLTTIPIGPGLPNTLAGGFTTIGNALGTGFAQSLGNTGISAPVILELQSGYTSEVTTTSLVITNNACFTAINNVTIRPAGPSPGPAANGLVISSSVAGPTIDMDGAKYVVFDGTPGGTSGTPSMSPIVAGTNNATNLNIKNTSTTGTAFRFKNDASNNTVKYCDLQGSNSSGPLTATGTAVLADRGVIFIGTTTGATGNDNVIIDHCNIHPAVANATMTMGIYSYSTQASAPVPSFNDLCQITNNNIYDIYGGTALGSTGIGLGGGTDSWTITGNSFFQTASRTPVLTLSIVNRAIFVAPTNPGTGQGNNFTITGNFIGGTAPSCGGTAMTLNATGSLNNQLTALEISVAGGSASNVKTNTFTNISVSQGTSTGDIMRAIAVTNNGNVNVGGSLSTDGNIIGSSTATNVIALGTTGTSAAPSHMILVSGGATSATNIQVKNNKIGGVRTTGAGSSLTGIFCNSTATITIDNNLIGSTTVANSFEASGNTITAQMVNGIRIPSGSSTATITNNTICGLNNNSTSTTAVTGNSATVPPQTGGIIITGSTTTVLVQSISNNIIRNLSNAAPTGSNLQSAALVGIGTNSTSATAMIISNNTIDSLFSTATTGSVLLEGISYVGSTSNTNVISGNFIHSIGVNSASTTASIRGIEAATGSVSVVNNMIRLGILANGSSLTNPITIYGILNSATTQNFYYNTVYIGGSGVAAGANNTFAFWRNSTLAANSKNNIFYNARSGAGAGRHYSIYFASATAFTSVLSLNNNIYLANGTNGTFAFNGTANVTSYTPGWFTGDLNSVYGNPVLINPTGTATGVSPAVVDLHCNTSVGSAAESNGVIVSGINIDIDGDTRQGSGGYSGTGTAPDIGADEFAGIIAIPNINSVSISPNTTQCVAVPHAVTASVTASDSYQWKRQWHFCLGWNYSCAGTCRCNYCLDSNSQRWVIFENLLIQHIC